MFFLNRYFSKWMWRYPSANGVEYMSRFASCLIQHQRVDLHMEQRLPFNWSSLPASYGGRCRRQFCFLPARRWVLPDGRELHVWVAYRCCVFGVHPYFISERMRYTFWSVPSRAPRNRRDISFGCVDKLRVRLDQNGRAFGGRMATNKIRTAKWGTVDRHFWQCGRKRLQSTLHLLMQYWHDDKCWSKGWRIYVRPLSCWNQIWIDFIIATTSKANVSSPLSCSYCQKRPRYCYNHVPILSTRLHGTSNNVMWRSFQRLNINADWCSWTSVIFQ